MSDRSFVYAVACEDLVKIGWSSDPHSRVSKISADATGPCKLLGYISATKEQESEFHALLAPYRKHGEWFYRVAAVEEFLARLPAPEPRQRRKAQNGIHPLRVYRNQTGTSLKEFGDRICLSHSQLSRIESGKQQATAEVAMEIELATGGVVRRAQLRPDLWGAAA